MLEAIQNSSLSEWITSERWVVTSNSKQILETLHFLAFELQIGAIIIISMRVLGLGKGVPIATLARPLVWFIWPGFAAVFVTGVLQFIPIATDVFYRPSFHAKMGMLVIAVASVAWLHARVLRRAAAWDAGAPIPVSLKVLALFSLLLWLSVIVVARLMYAFVQMAGP